MLLFANVLHVVQVIINLDYDTMIWNNPTRGLWKCIPSDVSGVAMFRSVSISL